MKVLLSWLRQFAPLEGSPDELAKVMNTLGMATEEVTVLPSHDGVVVARVAGLRPHPSADRIQLVDIDAGDGSQLQVCCGAFNMAEGDLVPLASVGTTMGDGTAISERQMRGELSQGMCCSPAELGLGDDHEGILILPDDLTVGQPLMEQLGLAGDVLFDLEINPNRPDAMSVAGVARDVAAAMGVPFTMVAPTVTESSDPDDRIEALASVRIADPTLCGRFATRVVKGITVGTSPLWMQMRLRLCGMRPINTVVDVSNYVMLELGTPSHAFDLALLPQGHLATRRSREGETLETLDGQQRTLVAGDGLIIDVDDRPIGIAGVMGGASTEISATTTAVQVEMAWWDPTSIAATSGRLGLRSEASVRFERGTDWALNVTALDRFCELLQDVTPGGVTVCAGVLDERGGLATPQSVQVRPSRVSHLLGQPFAAQQVAALLEPIGFGVTLADGAAVTAANAADPDATLTVAIPSFRPDVATETDVIEEVARHFGYDQLGRTVPRPPHAGSLTRTQQLRRRLRQVMLGEGLSEAMPNPFLATDSLSRAGLDDVDPVLLLNPLASEESVLRPSLLPGLLEATAHNAAHRTYDAELFELGVVFNQPAEGRAGGSADPHDPHTAWLPAESERLAALCCGADAWRAVALWFVLAEELGVEAAVVNDSDVAGLHPGRAASIAIGSGGAEQVPVGVLGELDPAVCERFGLPERCAWFEVDAGALMAAATAGTATPYQPVSTYPSTDFDLAFVLADSVGADALEATLREAAGSELVLLELFDTYRGSQLGEGLRSLAYRLRLQAADRTLTDADVAAARQRCIDAAASHHQAVLRA